MFADVSTLSNEDGSGGRVDNCRRYFVIAIEYSHKSKAAWEYV